MDSLQKKTLQTSRFTYTYYASDPRPQGPTLLLLHGFPDDAHLWNEIVKQLGQYQLIVPDLLGYSGTSKPTDPSKYGYGDATQDLVEILDAEGTRRVVSIGHDFGSMIAQNLYVRHRERVEGLVLVNVPYMAPSMKEAFDLKATNAQVEKIYGYPLLAYQEFFVSDEAPTVLRDNVDRFYEALHGAPRDWVRDMFCVRGNLRKFVLDEEKDWNVELRPYAQDPEHRRAFVERFRRDGFEAPLCYYHAMCNNVQFEAAKDIPEKNFAVHVPTLFIQCEQDPLSRSEVMMPAKEGGLLPDLEEASIDSAHWSPFEKPDEISDLIKSFLERKFTS